ncbi:hypothetical protein LX36DRAFT_257932 [Colletotrichum falcatum]|nr:hypothetical protein LX36DRAFT_257932 [Colletotrichum falcatum]
MECRKPSRQPMACSLSPPPFGCRYSPGAKRLLWALRGLQPVVPGHPFARYHDRFDDLVLKPIPRRAPANLGTLGLSSPFGSPYSGISTPEATSPPPPSNCSRPALLRLVYQAITLFLRGFPISDMHARDAHLRILRSSGTGPDYLTIVCRPRRCGNRASSPALGGNLVLKAQLHLLRNDPVVRRPART